MAIEVDAIIADILRDDIRKAETAEQFGEVCRLEAVLKQTAASIRTTFIYPPIPIRSMDWSAIDDSTYDGAEDSHCPIGYGATEADAIRDLLQQICE